MEVNNIKNLNDRLCDRTNIYYWQSDRDATVEEITTKWLDRHSSILNEELFENVNKVLSANKLVCIEEFDPKKIRGSVNSSRVGTLDNGEKVIIRCHPKGVKNGYFFVESLVASICKQKGIPTYKTYAIHELENDNDISYQVIEKMNGLNIVDYLIANPQDEDKIVYDMGKICAEINSIKINGFGPFDNEKAKSGELKGLHPTLISAINAGLADNLETCVKNNLFSKSISDKILKLFDNNNLLDVKEAVLIHNDFADWNGLADNGKVTAVLDFDECVGGDAIEEIACWSLFFEPQRVNQFIKGYYSTTKMPANFEEKFQLFRLRYIVSKMTLRFKRFEYDKSDFVIDKINQGKAHLIESMKYYGF